MSNLHTIYVFLTNAFHNHVGVAEELVIEVPLPSKLQDESKGIALPIFRPRPTTLIFEGRLLRMPTATVSSALPK